ncbi:MAG: winged helix-turn-helix transcriptional regulator [Desulfobacula sp.]|jgi:DNA-binding MarR family transcriptional regulator|nr:winged helix-turn-helix transcriptional regulator [Desulfobacula sp.]MBT7049510.1 winged helix-turn-helix transcriptional regulator [Desulfobacula sp.]
MNHTVTENTSVTQYQITEFQNLINTLFQCCQERLQYQSGKFDLPDAELRCLMFFKDEKYLTSKNISIKMNVGKSRMTKIVAGLLGKDLIMRIKDPEDSRISLISLTRKGKEKLVEIKAFQDDLHRAVLSQVSDRERKKLLTNLDLLKACMESGKEFMTNV